MRYLKVGDECPVDIRLRCAWKSCGTCSECNFHTRYRVCKHCPEGILLKCEEFREILKEKVTDEL